MYRVSIMAMYLSIVTEARSLFMLAAMKYDKKLETIARTTKGMGASLKTGRLVIHQGLFSSDFGHTSLG